MKNKILFISLFLCEAIPTFIVTHFIFADYTISSSSVTLLALSLILSWFFADKYQKIIKKVGYTVLFLGIIASIPYFYNLDSSSGTLIAILSLMIGVNLSLRERKMLAYLLIFSFIFFLFASSIVYNQYSIASIVLFTFSFFSVVIVDYYLSKLPIQSHYTYQKSNHFLGTTSTLVFIVTILTAGLYYLLPQPEATHYGVFPFGGDKKYTGSNGEENSNSRYHKDKTTQLPQYTLNGKREKNSSDLLVFYKQGYKDSQVYSAQEKEIQKQKEVSTQKRLKTKNKKAYYSSIATQIETEMDEILFEVKGDKARFLRGNTYGSFDGKTWKKVLTKIYTIKKGSEDYKHYWNGKEWKRRTKPFIKNVFYYNEYFTQKSQNYTITIKGKLAGKPIIYTPSGLLRLQFPSDTFYEDASRVIYAPSQLEIGTYYTASVENESYYGYDAMSYADVWYKNTYLYSTYKLDNRILELAKKLTKGSKNSFEKAQDIVNYFKSNYLYKHSSLESSIHNQTLSQMLFESKVGDALQFNTALIMMLRSSGTYARLVTGYAPNEYNHLTASYLVERKNKSVWTEVFVKERGWVSIHAADDIPYEGEETDLKTSYIALSNIQIIASIILITTVILLAFYYNRKYLWIYMTKNRINKYKEEKNDVDFVITTFNELENYFSKFNKGKQSSFTVQEYEQFIKKIKPENSYLIEYISFYSNQAIYNKKLDVEFDKNRYTEISIYLVDKPFQLESLGSYIRRKIKL